MENRHNQCEAFTGLREGKELFFHKELLQKSTRTLTILQNMDQELP